MKKETIRSMDAMPVKGTQKFFLLPLLFCFWQCFLEPVYPSNIHSSYRSNLWMKFDIFVCVIIFFISKIFSKFLDMTSLSTKYTCLEVLCNHLKSVSSISFGLQLTLMCFFFFCLLNFTIVKINLYSTIYQIYYYMSVYLLNTNEMYIFM